MEEETARVVEGVRSDWAAQFQLCDLPYGDAKYNTSCPVLCSKGSRFEASEHGDGRCGTRTADVDGNGQPRVKVQG